MTYTLPHPLDRPGQQEAFDWLMSSKKKYLIVRAPTGSGKSAWVAEASKTHRVMVLTETKSLQSTNYKDSYGFNILYGKSNYDCLENQWYTAYDCGNPECDCPYNQAVNECMGSPRVSLNYDKFLMSNSFVMTYAPDILFLDEGHNLRAITKEHIGLTIEWNNQFINYPNPPSSAMQLTQIEALHLFNECLKLVEINKPEQREQILPSGRVSLERWRKWKRLYQKMAITEAVINLELKDWYFEADEEKLLIKPLSAKYHFKWMFGKARKVILMSATIKPNIADKLGIDESQFDFYEVPNPWPSPMRLVYDLDCPRMSFNCTDEDRDLQAIKIASVLKQDKTGTIHVSSEFQAKDLSERLFELGWSTWIPEKGSGTDNQLREWYNRRKPGLYCISFSFHEGVDLGGDNIGILAKIPYASIGSNYDRAVMEYDKAAYKQDAADLVEQTCGRPRRGKAEHYGDTKRVYIADGSWKSLKSWLSADFRKAIRKWNGT